ncbi:RING zinc finger family [Micractinium conductrix]|uniref:RING zinc finger family n=1 Tax=Micractinium conductrix TaxID=554055 RepID=A0A2P6V7K5_9CHLO|nr:RING zinc finger family [Micractinium conductrix]|eukprot:PSC70058.1 RING zinc finger family [Micractinium conductrix]
MAAAAASAAVGTCAVCLCDLLPSEEAFLDSCFHHFHLQCIERWAEAQLDNPPAHGSPLSCPLCRSPFESAVFDCEGGAFRRRFFGLRHRTAAAAEQAGGSGSLALTAQHRRRRAVYATPLTPEELHVRRQRVAGLTQAQAQRPAVEEFAARELQALMLTADVALVASHVAATHD